MRKRIDWLNHFLEFIVVIVGILLAFQLNKCSAERDQGKTIAIHFDQLNQETKLNKKYLEYSITAAKLNDARLDTIFMLLNTRDDYSKVNTLCMHLLDFGGAYFRKAAYFNLTETGDIRFIKDFDTKKRIVDLYEYYKWVEMYDEIATKLFTEDYYPYLKDNFDFVTAAVQNENVYQTKVFKNILGAYQRTNKNKIGKYTDCIKEMDKFLGIE